MTTRREEMNNYEPKLICYSCNFSWGFLAGEKALAPLAPMIKNWIPVVCSGKVDSTHLLEAFRQGADGILILGCPEGHCHFQDGNYQTSKKVYLLRKVLDAFGIEQKRLRIRFGLDADGKKIPQVVKEMSESIRHLGPLRLARAGQPEESEKERGKEEI